MSPAEPGASVSSELSLSPGGSNTLQLGNYFEIKLIDENGDPCRGERFAIRLPDGRIELGKLDEEGCGRVFTNSTEPAQVCFPDLDNSVWSPADDDSAEDSD